MAEFCAEIGFGLHNLIGTTNRDWWSRPVWWSATYGFRLPPNFAP